MLLKNVNSTGNPRPHSASSKFGDASSLNSAMHYEHLLMVQQRQHQLSLEQKNAEIAHLKAYIDHFEAASDEKEPYLFEVIRTKEEEIALMMAAKHKELELMVSLLQLREQQIEELRSLCEDNHPDWEQTQRSEGDSSSLDTQREFRRLRLRMEELEASMGEQNERSALLAKELHLKSDRVEVLEEQIRQLQQLSPATLEMHCSASPEQSRISTPRPTNSELGFNLAEPLALQRLSGPRADAPGQGRSQPLFSRLPWTTNSQDFADADGSLPSQLPSYRSAIREEMADTTDDVSGHRVTPLFGSTFQRHAEHGNNSFAGRSKFQTEQTETAETGKQSQELLREMKRLRLQMSELEKVASGRGGSVQLPSSVASPLQHENGHQGSYKKQQEPLQTSIKHYHDSHKLHEHQLQHLPSHPQPPNRSQSPKHQLSISRHKAQLLLQEQEQSLQQYPRQQLTVERMATGMSSLSTLSGRIFDQASSGNHSIREPVAHTTASEGLASSHSHSEFADGAAITSADMHPNGTSFVFGHATSSKPGSVRSEDQGSASEFPGWEYRPQENDPVDVAVATLVNKPGGRYRSLRALLCRLERGVYLCGTRRVHLRADASSEKIEASDDGIKWTDLEEQPSRRQVVY